MGDTLPRVSRHKVCPCLTGNFTKPSPVLSWSLTAMDVFENCTVLLDLKNIPFKEKKRLRTAVTEHGGSICLLVNEQVARPPAVELDMKEMCRFEHCLFV